MDIFKAEKITKRFVNHTALSNISLNIPKQSIFGLLGPNGAGKTTFIRIINQIISPDEGQMFFEGEKIHPKHITSIGYLPEERGLYKKMKLGEQALYLAQLKGLDKKTAYKKLNYWFEKFELQKWWNRKVIELSKGMQQKVQFITTILHNPKLLIFDEPFSGFDPINVNMLKDEIIQLRDNGATVIFSTHNMESVEELCDHIVLIDNSKKILEGEVKAIKQKFKSDIYELTLKENKKHPSDILPKNYKVIAEEKEAGFIKIKVNIPPENTANQLLENLMPYFEINGFTEILPTMNEIFIAKVKDNKKTNSADR